MRKVLLLLTLLLSVITVFAQRSIIGVVVDGETGEGLPGVTVMVKNTTSGTITDIDGSFTLTAPLNEFEIEISYVGYVSYSSIVDGSMSDLGEVTLEVGTTELDVLEIVASRSTNDAPFTFSDVSKKSIQENLGSRDLPLVLNTTPSFYSTNQGGGAGDARLTVRGFDQRNVAIMINGVPVNDMENGWVYWSNWDGLGDAASSIQVQRGMSPVNLATPSIGGTMNIITDPAAKSRGAYFKQEAGSWGFFKSTLTYNTGLINDKLAMSATAVNKQGNGFSDGTYTRAWAYYFGMSYKLSDKDKIEAFAIGAPQRHGQNLYRQNIGTYSRDFAESLDTYDAAAFDDYQERGRSFNQNMGSVSGNYTGNQFYKMYRSRDKARFSEDFLLERENFFHKPQVNLNYYHSFNDDMQWTTIAYYSGGKGGGAGTYGEVLRKDANGVSSADVPFFFGPGPWEWDWDATIAVNQAPAGTDWTNDFDNGTKTDAGESIGIIRASKNDQYTLGAISKLFWDVSDNLTVNFGVDWRTAQIDHYREVRDLLGGQYFRFTGNQFESTDQQYRKVLGDKIDYDFTNTVDWLGGFAQAEYKTEKFTGSLMTGYTTTKFTHENHFVQDGGDKLLIDGGRYGGYQVKTGGSYKITNDLNIYANYGYVAKTPNFDRVIDDETYSLFSDAQNETFNSIEIGATERLGSKFVVNVNYYNTLWSNRTQKEELENPNSGEDVFVLISDIEQRNSGFELETSFMPVKALRFDGGLSIANWYFTKDVPIRLTQNDSRGNVVDQWDETLYIEGIKVGNAPQTQFFLTASVFPVKGLMLKADVRYYDKFYADYNPVGRLALEDPDGDGTADERPQSWKVPSYSLIDFHSTYDLPFNDLPVSFQVFLHVFNVLDQVYIQDAGDNSRFNAFDGDHDADDAEVFFGLPRNINGGLVIRF
ncbi:MAG: TonB-dependent receptor [Cyclobacteriaceae bacterium]